MIDVDAFRREFGFAEECRDCKRIAKWECASQMYSARDICGWLDDTPIMTEWISVKDRLPGKSGDYIAYTKDGLVWPYFFQGDTWYDQLGFRTETVTHWRQMPEPPEEVSEDG